GFVHGQNVLDRGGRGGEVVRQFDPPRLAAAFQSGLPPGALDENAAHRFRGGGEEVPPAVELNRKLPPPVRHETHGGFVNERRRVERVSRLLLGHSGRREPPQLLIDERQQLLGGARVALLQGSEDAGNLIHGNKLTRLRAARASHFLFGIHFGHVSSLFSRSSKVRPS